MRRLKALLLHYGFLMRDHSDQNVRCAWFQICTKNSKAPSKIHALTFPLYVCPSLKWWAGDGLGITEVTLYSSSRLKFGLKLSKNATLYIKPTFLLRSIMLLHIIDVLLNFYSRTLPSGSLSGWMFQSGNRSQTVGPLSDLCTQLFRWAHLVF